MVKENDGDRLTFRTSSRLLSQLDEIKDLDDLDYTSDAIRVAIEFYHGYAVEGKGIGKTLVLHLPVGIIDMADTLCGWTDNDMQGVLKHAMNMGLSFMIDDAIDAQEKMSRIRKVKTKAIQNLRSKHITVGK